MKSILFISLLILVASAQNCKKDGGSKGDDSVCAAPNGSNSQYCCLYWSLEADGDKTEGWLCSPVPSDESDDSAEVEGVKAEAYCDNALLMKVSFFVAAIVSLFAF